MSKVLALYHIVFSTKHHQATLNPNAKEQLHRLITKIIKEEDCYLERINSNPDHVHMLIDLNPKKALADVVSKIKSYSSSWLKKSGVNPLFTEWTPGYYASSISLGHKMPVIDYIINQEAHHANLPYEEEMRTLYLKAGLRWHDNDMK